MLHAEASHVLQNAIMLDSTFCTAYLPDITNDAYIGSTCRPLRVVLGTWHDSYLQSNDDMRTGYYGVNDCVGHGSMAATAADGDLELLAGPHERACTAAQCARGQEGPHVQSKDCTHPFQGS
jgi:hypothetical protein